MLPSPRPARQMHWLELTLKLAITLAMGYFLINNLLAYRRLQAADPAQFKPAEQALKANKPDVARAELDRYLRANENSARAYSLVIGFCARNKRADLVADYSARAEHDTAAAPADERVSLLTTISQAYLDIPKPLPAQALAAAEQAYKLLPDSAEAQNTLAYTLAETTTEPARLSQARDLIVRALTALNSQVGGPEHQFLLALFEDTYGWVLYKQGLYGSAKDATANYAHAVDVLMQALNDMPEEAKDLERKDIYYHLGAAYNKIGRPDDARHVLEIVLHYDPDNEAAQKEYKSLPAPPAPISAAPAVGTALRQGTDATVVKPFTPLQSTSQTPAVAPGGKR